MYEYTTVYPFTFFFTELNISFTNLQTIIKPESHLTSPTAFEKGKQVNIQISAILETLFYFNRHSSF